MKNLSQIDFLAKKVWDYLVLDQKLELADIIWGLGSHDIRVAERTAEIYKQDFSNLVLFSGGKGKITKDINELSEAEKFRGVAIARGVPVESILIENKSSNTYENIKFSQELLEEKKVDIKSAIIVTKPYMERRCYSIFKVHWPELNIIITSPQLSYEEYCKDEDYKDMTINLMIGDLQRIREFPKKGWQIPQDIPDEVWNAYEELVKLGYDKHLIKE